MELKHYKGISKETGEEVQGTLNILARYDAYFLFRTYKRLDNNRVLPLVEVEKDSIEEIESHDFYLEKVDNKN